MQLKSLINKKGEQIILASMLISLHLSIWLDFGSPISRALLLVHLGLFIIWQPIQDPDLLIKKLNAVIFIILTFAFVYWINWELINIWIILLIGLVGGRVITNRSQRNIYLLVMILLIMELLTISLPKQFGMAINPLIFKFTKYLIPSIPVLILIFPANLGRNVVYRVDLLQATTAALLAAILALGTLIFFYHYKTDYYTALIQTSIFTGFFLIALSWLSSPHSGFSGLSQLWTQSLLNIGTPFEKWLIELSEIKQEVQSADEFLERALHKLLTLPWIAGVIYTTDSSSIDIGHKTNFKVNSTIHGQPVTICTQISVGGALLLHCNLLVQLIDNFHSAKLNEKQLAKQTHLQAIYETGSRITHDIKNLLQSMHSMTSLLEQGDENEKSMAQSLLKKQMPYFIQQLELAMNKLQAPNKISIKKEYISDWWQTLQTRYKTKVTSFNQNIKSDILVPIELFNTVAENLIENSMAKQKDDDDINISIELNSTVTDLILVVKDTGQCIDKKIADQLFIGPVDSAQGLGIGLYQSSQLAQSLGFTLKLASNETGNVSFELINN